MASSPPLSPTARHQGQAFNLVTVAISALSLLDLLGVTNGPEEDHEIPQLHRLDNSAMQVSIYKRFLPETVVHSPGQRPLSRLPCASISGERAKTLLNGKSGFASDRNPPCSWW